jgi:pimeloyl-ACP methyl ester carboxylesterase
LETIRRPATGGLAYETHGGGTPVVFLHGLTFDRTMWRPIIERLGEGVCSIAFDLPGHGETAGDPCGLPEAAARVNSALRSLGVGEPLIVGHSISSGIASIYAASYPVRGLVNVEGTVDIRPMAESVRRLEPVLRGEHFADAFARYEQSMGFEYVPEPLRARLLESQDIRQEVVLGYWDQLFRKEPRELQDEIEAMMVSIVAPCLCVFGHCLNTGERTYLHDHLSDLQIEEWPDRGHLVHLAEPDRFAARLRSFVDHCRSAGERPSGEHDGVITRARMYELVDEDFRAEVAGDLRAIADGFTAHAEHDVAGRPGPALRGADQIRAFYKDLLADLQITLRACAPGTARIISPTSRSCTRSRPGGPSVSTAAAATCTPGSCTSSTSPMTASTVNAPGSILPLSNNSSLHEHGYSTAAARRDPHHPRRTRVYRRLDRCANAPGRQQMMRRARRLSPPMAQPRTRQQHRDRRPLDHRAKRHPQHLRVHQARDPPTPRAPGPDQPGLRLPSAVGRYVRLGARIPTRDDPTVRRDHVSPTDTRTPPHRRRHRHRDRGPRPRIHPLKGT